MTLLEKFKKYVRFIHATSEKEILIPFKRTPGQPIYDKYQSKKSIYQGKKIKQAHNRNN